MTELIRTLIVFDEPTSRLYYINILVALVLTLLWIFFHFRLFFYKRTNRIKKILYLIFLNPRFWFHRSAWIDYGLLIFNLLIKVILVTTFVQLTYSMALGLIALFDRLDISITPRSTTFSNIFGFTAMVFILDDFLRFFHHYLQHRIGWLWYFHQVHHSAQVLTPFTLYRTHPFEALQAMFRNSLLLAFSAAIFGIIFQAPLTLWTIIGINGFERAGK